MAEKSTQTVASSDVPESRQTDTTQSSMIRLNAYTRLIALQTGLHILYWDARTKHNFSYSAYHDDDLIYFGAYTGGNSHMETRCWDGLTTYDTLSKPDDAYVAYRPGCRIDFTKAAGAGAGVTITLSPTTLASLSAEDATCLDQKLRSGHYFNQVRGGRQLLSFANALRSVGTSPKRPGCQLQMLGQSLSFMGSLIEQVCHIAPPNVSLSEREIRRLNDTRDMLLADLASPPRLDQLARHAGMSVSRLQRHFRMLFGSTIYALFQKERMHEAYRQLVKDDESILTIATRMGYANPGHFSAAFRKQFGINPSELRRIPRLRR